MSEAHFIALLGLSGVVLAVSLLTRYGGKPKAGTQYLVQPRIEYNIEPLLVKIEIAWNPEDEERLNLSPDEAAWQRRRMIASKAADKIFELVMLKDSPIADTTIVPENRHPKAPYRTETRITILPVQQL